MAGYHSGLVDWYNFIWKQLDFFGIRMRFATLPMGETSWPLQSRFGGPHALYHVQVLVLQIYPSFLFLSPQKSLSGIFHCCPLIYVLWQGHSFLLKVNNANEMSHSVCKMGVHMVHRGWDSHSDQQSSDAPYGWEPPEIDKWCTASEIKFLSAEFIWNLQYINLLSIVWKA